MNEKDKISIDTKCFVDKSYLIDWYISSVSGKDTPVWTIEHIEELCRDFDVYVK